MIRSWRSLIDWLGSHGGLVLLAVLLVVGGTYGFIRLADQVREGSTQEFDEWMVRIVASYEGPEWLEEAGRDVTAVGGPAVLGLVVAAVAGYLLIQRRYNALMVVLVATVGALLLSIGLKYVIDRERPDLVVHRSQALTQSFPSGHSMVSAVVYLTLGSLLARFERKRTVKVYCLMVALMLTFLVGVSRVYMGVHWPTDVLAGWTAGLVWALTCWLVTYYLQRRGAVPYEREQEPAGTADARR